MTFSFVLIKRRNNLSCKNNVVSLHPISDGNQTKCYASTADVNVRNSNQCAAWYDGSRVLAWTAPISAH